MAELPSVKRIVREDIKDAPEWIEGVIGPINTFMEEVYYALNADLTVGQNLRGALKSINFATRSTYNTDPANFDVIKFINPMPVKPQVVCLGGIVNRDDFSIITNPITIDWDFYDGQIRIRYVAGLTANKRYELKLLIL
jgi:hypothetical protein